VWRCGEAAGVLIKLITGGQINNIALITTSEAKLMKAEKLTTCVKVARF
jgi:hypothetical protein